MRPLRYSYFTAEGGGPNPNGSWTVDDIASIPCDAKTIYAVNDGVRIAMIAASGRIIQPMDDRSYEVATIAEY